MKQLPTCITCAKSDGMICEHCEERLETGELTNLDIDISEILLEIEEANPDSKLSEASFFKSIELDRMTILVIGKGETDIFKPWIKKLAKELQLNRIEFIEKSKDSSDLKARISEKELKNVVNDFVKPGKLVGINKLFLPTGDDEYKARVQIKQGERLPLSKENLEKIIKELTNTIVRIETQVVQ
ncbi:MAG: hypothetical protein GYA24_13075 [Candidatus Lokiarchaeota archaeon]|nr:hypothetical protein [Candidatus Lokiarchaeota archaeon]